MNGARIPRLIAATLALAAAGAGTVRAATASATFTYDPTGRVMTALYDNGVCVVYAYDAAGNRTAQTNSSSSPVETPTWGTGTWGCTSWTLTMAARMSPPKGPTSAKAQRPLQASHP